MKCKVLVTGGAGYVGSHTVVSLAQAGYHPVIVDNFSNVSRKNIKRIKALVKGPISVYEGDCCVAQLLGRIFQKERRIEAVIHFAALKSVRESFKKPLAYYANNLGAMNVTTSAAVAVGLKYFILSSSSTVYGVPRQLPVKESATLGRAQSPYGLTKQGSEMILKQACGANSLLWGIALRYFNPIGAHPSGELGEDATGAAQNFVPILMQAAAGERKLVTVFGNDHKTDDGTCVRDYVHVMDVADAHVAALEYLESGRGRMRFDVFNIGLGRGYSVLEMINACEEVIGRKIKYRIGPKALGDIAAIYADVYKAKHLLGFQARYSLKQGLTDAWAWQQRLRSAFPNVDTVSNKRRRSC